METNSRYKLSKVDDPLHDELQKLIEIRELYKADPTKELGMKLIKQAQKVLALSPNPKYSKADIEELNKVEDPKNILMEIDKKEAEEFYEEIIRYFEKNLLNKYIEVTLPYYGKTRLVFTRMFCSETMSFRYQTVPSKQRLLGKRILLAFSRIKEIISQGQVTDWEKTIYKEDRQGKIKHENWLFIKFKKNLVDTDGKNFEAAVTLNYPKGFGRVWPYKVNTNQEVLDSVQKEDLQISMRLEVSLE